VVGRIGTLADARMFTRRLHGVVWPVVWPWHRQ